MKTKERRYYHSSSFKMALLFTILLGLSIFILGYFAYYFIRGNQINGADTLLNAQTDNVAVLDRMGLIPGIPENVAYPDGVLLNVKNSNGDSVGGNIDFVPEALQKNPEKKLEFEYQGKIFYGRIYKALDGGEVFIAVDVTNSVKSYNLMAWLSILSILLTVSVIAISFLISVFVVSRTNRIAMAAKDIMDTGDLSKRIEIDSRWDDLSYVAQVLNAFLDRIEKLIENVRQVSDNIAHDMRTPLTRLRNDLEKLRKDDADNAEKYDAVIKEADHILTIFGALLRISNVEANQEKYLFTQVDIAKIARDVADLYEPLAEEKGISLIVRVNSVLMSGDRDLLFQALANLIDNAIKFTPENGEVVLSLDESGLLSVYDTGPGVDEADMQKIFRRFYRTEKSRHAKGNGLGLSMVDAVIKAHSATIIARNMNPGFSIDIRFSRS